MPTAWLQTEGGELSTGTEADFEAVELGQRNEAGDRALVVTAEYLEGVARRA